MSAINQLRQNRRIMGMYRTLREKYTAKRLFVLGTFLLILLLIGTPLVVYVWGSFWTTLPGSGGHFTLSGYQQAITSEQVASTLVNTFAIAVIGTVIAITMGVATVALTTKTNIPFKNLISFLLIVQYLLPAYIAAYAWRFYVGDSGPINQALMWLPFFDSPPLNIFTVWGIGLVTGIHYAGLVYLLSSGAIRSVSAPMEEAAKMAGASTLTVFRTITVRFAVPSIAIAGVLIFVRLIQSFGAPLILGLPGNIFVLATQMYYAVINYPPNFTFASAIGMFIMLLSVVGLVVQRWITGARGQYETVGGRAEGKKTVILDLGSKGPLISGISLTVFFFLIAMPFITMIMGSFQRATVGFNFEYVRWTLDAYRVILLGSWSNAFYHAAVNTLLISGIGAFFGMVVSSMAAYVITRGTSAWSDMLDILTLLPIAIPSIIIGVTLLWVWLTYNFLGLWGTIWIIMLGLTIKFIVIGTRAANSSMRSIGTDLEEIAEISGANLFTIFRTIFIPLIKPGFLAGYILLFIDYMKVLTLPLLLASGDNEVLSVLMWRALSGAGKTNISMAIATVLTVMIGVLYLITQRFTEADVTSI